MTQIRIDPELAAIVPALTPDEYNGLQSRLQADGRCDPGVSWKETGILLDGHNRYEICKVLNLEFATRAVSLPDRDAAKRWIIETQFARRNLNTSQRAMLAGQLATLEHGQHPRERNSAVSIPRERNSAVSIPRERNSAVSIPDVAKQMNVSGDSVKQARKVLADGSPALQAAVRDGKVPVSTAAAITELPTAEQNRLAEEGKKAIAAAAKAVAKPKPPALKDQEGRALPDDKPKIRVAFARRHEIVETMNGLSKIKIHVLQGADAKDPIYAELSVSDFQMACERARAALRYSAPHAVCPYCSGDGCRACKGKGWVGLAIYSAAPSEMKGKK